MGKVLRCRDVEIPADATGLIWHDGKKAYELEPHPKLLEASK